MGRIYELVLAKIDTCALADVEGYGWIETHGLETAESATQVLTVEVEAHLHKVHVHQDPDHVAKMPSLAVALTAHAPFLYSETINRPAMHVVSHALTTHRVAMELGVSPADLHQAVGQETHLIKPSARAVVHDSARKLEGGEVCQSTHLVVHYLHLSRDGSHL